MGVLRFHECDDYVAGYLTGSIDKNQKLHDDWRAEFTDKPGIIVIFYKDEKQHNGYVCFCKITGQSGYMQTSTGKITRTKDTIQIKTKNSTYFFSIDEKDISNTQKMQLLQTFGIKKKSEDKSKEPTEDTKMMR